MPGIVLHTGDRKVSSVLLGMVTFLHVYTYVCRDEMGGQTCSDRAVPGPDAMWALKGRVQDRLRKASWRRRLLSCQGD